MRREDVEEPDVARLGAQSLSRAELKLDRLRESQAAARHLKQGRLGQGDIRRSRWQGHQRRRPSRAERAP
jgi:hypothetical protein